MKLLAAEPIAGDGLQMVWETTIELEGAPKPACVAESVVRRFR
jgi:acyl dehydratase